jgi:SH3-like domain-containing protein
MIRPHRFIAAAALFAATGASAQERQVPYWASIAAGKALMRTGPERIYPATWLYQRRDLPVRVLQVMGAWRRVQEQDGTSGWMLATLLSARRSGIVTGGVQSVVERPEPGAPLLWRVEPGVVGRISKCDGRWCRIQIGDKTGFIAQTALWGTDPGETIED